MAVIPASFCQVNFLFGGVGYPTGAEVTCGFDVPGLTDPADIADLMADAYADHLRARVPTAVTLNSILVKVGPNDTGPFAELGVGSVGTGDAGQVNPNMAILIQKRTALGGRANRGRMFWPVTEGQTGQAGTLGTIQVDDTNDAFALWQSQVIAGEATPVILHVNPALTPTPITSFACQALTATQRRRLRR